MEYPLITALPNSSAAVTEISVPITDSQSLEVLLLEDEQGAVEEALLRAEQGQQVLWIENTVKEAQARYLQLASRANSLGVDCGYCIRVTPLKTVKLSKNGLICLVNQLVQTSANNKAVS